MSTELKMVEIDTKWFKTLSKENNDVCRFQGKNLSTLSPIIFGTKYDRDKPYFTAESWDEWDQTQL